MKMDKGVKLYSFSLTLLAHIRKNSIVLSDFSTVYQTDRKETIDSCHCVLGHLVTPSIYSFQVWVLQIGPAWLIVCESECFGSTLRSQNELAKSL